MADNGEKYDWTRWIDRLPRLGRGALMVAAVLFALAYVGMGMAAFGGVRAYCASPQRSIASALLVALAALTPLCGCNTSGGQREDPSNHWIFLPLLIAGLLLGCIPAYGDHHNEWTIGHEAVRNAGLALFALGCVLRVASILTLGRRFSVWVAIQDGHQLATGGLYRLVRHPSYTGALLTLFGWALVFRSMPGVFLALLMVGPIISRIGAEERLLDETFGHAYRAYRARTWRLAPFVY
jgi:protein-S-isoprenylcysteine O-methyltransferase Ste14